MATQIIRTRYRLRRDTAANWTSVNPVLQPGEPGYEMDTRKIKYGDGSTAWNDLLYAGSSGSGTPGGSSGQAQVNNAGSFSGIAALLVNLVTGRLTQAGFGATTAPSTPSSGFTLYANISHALSWIGQNGFRRTFDGTANTADRTYVLPDANGTIAQVAGSSGHAQYNNAGASGGAPHLLIDPATGRVSIAGFVARTTPATPSSGFTLFANAGNAFGWIGQNGFTRTLDGTSNTSDRIYTLQNKSGVVAHLDDTVRNVWIPAAQWIPATTNGCGINSLETGTNRVNYDVLEFDAVTSEQADCIITLPNNWTYGTVAARFYWTAASGSGGVVFQLTGLALGDNVAIDTALGTAQSAADTLLTANAMHVSSATSAITIAGTPAANKPVQFQVKRLPADASDTLAVDARLIGVEVIF